VLGIGYIIGRGVSSGRLTFSSLPSLLILGLFVSPTIIYIYDSLLDLLVSIFSINFAIFCFINHLFWNLYYNCVPQCFDILCIYTLEINSNVLHV
jgi:hypothetical protein